MSRPIPVRTAQRVHLETGNDLVIIIGWGPDDNTTHIATYGATKGLCKYAADRGRSIAKFLGLTVEER